MTSGPGIRSVQNAICTECGCTCDDIELQVRDRRILEARRACERGREWFRSLTTKEEPSAWVAGRPAKAEEATDAAANLLSTSRAPLVFGLRETSSEAQEVAVEIADRLGGTVDVAGSAARRAWMGALQRRGFASATLAEVRNRADLILLWYVDPEVSHPRFSERFLKSEGLYVTGARTVIEFREPGDTTSQLADRTFRIPQDRAFETLWWLRAVLQGRLEPASAKGPPGVSTGDLTDLAEHLTRCRYGVWLYDAESSPPDPGITQAVFALIEVLNERVPFAGLPLGGRGNARGAESVLTAHTGYPFAVNFAPGYPRFGPDEFSAPVILERGETDAVLLIGSDPAAHLPDKSRQGLRRVPTVVVDFRDGELMRLARAALRCAPYGVGAPATVYRTDGLALRARPAFESRLPSDARVLRLLADRLAHGAARRPQRAS